MYTYTQIYLHGFTLAGLDSRACLRLNLGDEPFALSSAALPPALHAPELSKNPIDAIEAAFRAAIACVVPKWGGDAAHLLLSQVATTVG